jgi:hypothetical protein
MKRRLALLLALAMATGWGQVRRPFPSRFASRGLRGAVAGGSEGATEAGMRMFLAGGNAVDAGIATMLAAAVVEFSHFGFGGEAPILVRTKEGKVFAIAGVGTMPQLGTADFYRKHTLTPLEIDDPPGPNGLKDWVPVVGILSTLVPGMVDAAIVAEREFGTKSFAEVLQPAIELADGFPLDEFRALSIENTGKYLSAWPSTRHVFLPNDAAPRAGSIFREPDPMDFNDHFGYVSLFDGVSLKGWDGNPKFWRAEGGAIVGESTPENPSGNTYIVYRDVEAHDFTLKFEMKIEGNGGSGLQYRSKTGIPWSRPIAANVIANTGPVNLNWMMTGPQADFWPAQVYTGQFYSENTPMGIMAWRGQAVEGAGLGSKRLMGNLGDRAELGKLVKMNDWNQYTVIARGGTLIHIVNGQVMAIMVDDDPASSNNQSGLFGIEIEAITRVSVRNMWLKKLN